MLKTKFLSSLLLTITLLVAQLGTVFAAPVQQESLPIMGMVQSITLETNIDTGITTVLVTVSGENDLSRRVRVSQETAITLGLLTLNADGNPTINNMALAQSIEVDPETAISDEEVGQHPIGSALVTFFSRITGLHYDQIMAAHNKGMGFGVIAQALWLTMKFKGDSEVFLAILNARQTGDYSAFTLDDGAIPKNWEQLRKAILDGSKNDNLGIAMSDKVKNEDKKNSNNANTNGNRDENNNGNGTNGNDQTKDKDKNKDKKK